MKRELMGAVAALVIATGFAGADDERSTRKSAASQRSSQQAMRATQQAMKQIKAARRALGEGDMEQAMAELKKSERTLKKVHDTPPMKAILNEIDDSIKVLEADPAPDEPVDLDALTAVVRKHKSWVDPEVSEYVVEANRSAEIGDNEGAAKSLHIARDKVAAEVAVLPSEDAYVRVLAAQRALERDETARAMKILDGIPAIADELRISTPLVPVRNKLEAAATAADSGNWNRASTLISQASDELDKIEEMAGDQPIAEEIAEIDDELDRIDDQIDQGGQPSARKLRELARRTRALGEG